MAQSVKSTWNAYSSNGAFNPDSLNDIDLKIPEKSVCAIVVTRNRSPYSPHRTNFKNNPLGWYVNSLLQQERDVLGEIVFVNDGSTDYTNETIRSLEPSLRKHGINVESITHKENQGSSKSRNHGLEATTKEHVFFGDDDCVLTRHSLAGALFSFQYLEEEGEKIAALHLPTYYRNTLPLTYKKQKDMMKLDLAKGIVEGSFNIFPSEFLNGHKGKFLSKESKIFRPIKATNLGGVFLAKKKSIQEVGGFPEYFPWRNAYSEETELALNLMEEGHSLFYTPDPKLSVVHLRVGDENLEAINKVRSKDLERHFGNGLNLRDMIRVASVPRANTGNRIETKEYLHARFMSWFVLLLKRHEEGAINWAKEMHNQFVEEESFTPYGITIPNNNQRQKIFRKAIKDGASLVTKLNGRDYSHITEKI